MQFKLFQIHLSDAEYDAVNANGHHAVPKQKAKLDIHFADNQGELASEAFAAGYYTHVANIDANDLNDVFEIGNIGPEENIERIAPMYSVSVGDLIEDEAGLRFVVANYGFKPAN